MEIHVLDFNLSYLLLGKHNILTTVNSKLVDEHLFKLVCYNWHGLSTSWL